MRDFRSMKKLDQDFSLMLELSLEYGMSDAYIIQEKLAKTGFISAQESVRDGMRNWASPQEIEELADISQRVPTNGVKVVRAVQGDGACGFTYLSELYPILGGYHLISLDEETIPSNLTLQELFLHELAHTFSFADGHDWNFLLSLTLLRSECGLGPTCDLYDYSNEMQDQWTISLESIPLRALSEVRNLRIQYSLEVLLGLIKTNQVGLVEERLETYDY